MAGQAMVHRPAQVLDSARVCAYASSGDTGACLDPCASQLQTIMRHCVHDRTRHSGAHTRKRTGTRGKGAAHQHVRRQVRRACPVCHHGHEHRDSTCTPLRERSGALSEVVPMQANSWLSLHTNAACSTGCKGRNGSGTCAVAACWLPVCAHGASQPEACTLLCMHGYTPRASSAQAQQEASTARLPSTARRGAAGAEVRLVLLCSIWQTWQRRARGSAPATCRTLSTRPRRRVHGGAHSAGQCRHPRCALSASSCLRRQQCGRRSVSVCPMHLRARALLSCAGSGERSVVERAPRQAASCESGRPAISLRAQRRLACIATCDAPRALRSATASLTGGSEACATCWSGAQAHREAAAPTLPSCTTFLKLQGAPQHRRARTRSAPQLQARGCGGGDGSHSALPEAAACVTVAEQSSSACQP